MAGANHAISVGASNAQLGARNAANAAIAGNNLSAANAIRDTNRGLADWAAKGDYANTIAALNAKVQDTKLTQPSMSGAFGGEVLRVLQEGFAIVARARRIDQAAIKRIGEYWLRYGYAVNQFAQIDRLDVMENFTYWKLSETYFKSATVPEYFKQTLRGIFEKGVTVWNDPDKIGMIDIADNKPLAGVELP